MRRAVVVHRDDRHFASLRGRDREPGIVDVHDGDRGYPALDRRSCETVIAEDDVGEEASLELGAAFSMNDCV